MSERDEWFYEHFEELIEGLIEEGKLDEEEVLNDKDEIDLDKIDDLDSILFEILNRFKESYYKTVKEDNEKLEDRKERIEEFEKRNYEHWKDSIDLLEKLIMASQGLSQGKQKDIYTDDFDIQEPVNTALYHLHARGCQVAEEILTLIKSGYADGAFARWRTLHEITCKAHTIEKEGEELAERFLAYSRMMDYYMANWMSESDDELITEEIGDEELEELQKMKDELTDEFENLDDNGYGTGWIKDVKEDGQAGMNDFEEIAGLTNLYPFRKISNAQVHANPKYTFERLGVINLPEDSREVMSLGPSNAGLELPGQLTAISLHSLNEVLAQKSASASDLGIVHAWSELINDIVNSLSKDAERLVEKERESYEEYSKMDAPEMALTNLGFEELFMENFIQEKTELDSKKKFLSEISSKNNRRKENKDLQKIVINETEFNSAENFLDDAFAHWVNENVEEVDVPGFE